MLVVGEHLHLGEVLSFVSGSGILPTGNNGRALSGGLSGLPESTWSGHMLTGIGRRAYQLLPMYVMFNISLNLCNGPVR